jgi:hypothetical protein
MMQSTRMVGGGGAGVPKPSALNASRSLKQKPPMVPQIPSPWSNGGVVPQPRPPQLQLNSYSNNPYNQQPNSRFPPPHSNFMAPPASPLTPGALVDRTPSPGYGEDVILLRGQNDSRTGFDSNNSGSSLDHERGASTAVGMSNSGQYQHTRNRSSGTQHFTGDPLGGYRATRNNFSRQ